MKKCCFFPNLLIKKLFFLLKNKKVEEQRIELWTSCMLSKRSTTELHSRIITFLNLIINNFRKLSLLINYVQNIYLLNKRRNIKKIVF